MLPEVKKWSSVLESGQLFSENCMKFMIEETRKANTHRITTFNHHSYNFSVEETMDHNEGRPVGYYRVEIHEGWCDSEKFQAFHMSCSHVIVACSSVHQKPILHLPGVYKVVNLFGVHRNSLSVVARGEYFPTYQRDVIYHDKNIGRNRKGRPTNT